MQVEVGYLPGNIYYLNITRKYQIHPLEIVYQALKKSEILVTFKQTSSFSKTRQRSLNFSILLTFYCTNCGKTFAFCFVLFWSYAIFHIIIGITTRSIVPPCVFYQNNTGFNYDLSVTILPQAFEINRASFCF